VNSLTCPCCGAAMVYEKDTAVPYKIVDAALRHLRGVHDARVTELLAHNNELLERCRQADRNTIEAREVARKAIIVAGEIAKQLPTGGG